MSIKNKILPALLLSWYSLANAQSSPFQFSRLDIRQGLSYDQVNTIYKDDKGFLWIGTVSGLNRYDGYTFKVFKHDAKDTASLGEDHVSRIFEGPDHKLWLNNSSDSLNIYDPVTEKFNRNPQALLASMHIANKPVKDIKKDVNGNFWFVISGAGIYKYDPVKHTTLHFHHLDGLSSTLHSDDVTDISETGWGGWWIIYNDGVMQSMKENGSIVSETAWLQQMYPKQSFEYRLFTDNQSDLWIYTSGGSKGAFYYKPAANMILHLEKDNGKLSINSNLVNGIVQDDKGLVWIATDHGGVSVVDKKNFSVSYVVSNEYDNTSLSQNCINTVYKDKDGIIWLGTFKTGLNYYHEQIIKFPLFKHQFADPNSLSYNDVNRFIEDCKGNLWIGTNGGGLVYYDRKANHFSKYVHDPSNPNSLGNDVIVSLFIDHDRKLWIGTYFGGLDCFDGKTFHHYRHHESDTTSLSDDSIWAILEDSQQRLWVGTLGSGLDLFDRKNNRFIHFRPNAPNSVHSTYVCSLMESSAGDIWISTGVGICILKKHADQFTYMAHDEAHPKTSLCDNKVIMLAEDSRGLMWIATRDGLDIYDPVRKTFNTLKKEDGLPDNAILSVVEDNNHNIWVSTPNGLCNIIVLPGGATGKMAFQCKNYNECDGLERKQFNEYAAYRTKAGELLFGGANGFNMFLPEQIKNAEYKPELVLTDLQVFNKSVMVGEKLNGHIILPKSITALKEISLRYDENVFSIEFAALNFFNTSKVRYAYTLESFNKGWLAADDKTRKASFTNLDPGTYFFRVRSLSDNGSWNSESTSLKIIILPPFWKTTLAYIIYILLGIALLLLARKILLQRAKTRFAIEQERQQAQHLHELDMMKIRFFTNVSHEFRTPLSLILSPLEKIIRNTTDPSGKNQFQLIHRNARRLLNMVNQLLDFRKMEVQELKLNTQPGDIIRFIKDISFSFTDLAEKKNIAFSYEAATESLLTWFDHDKIERILFNLLSNAFKFTPENGEVKVKLETTPGDNDQQVLLRLQITDTGIGIPEDKQEKIFERFFQHDVPGTMVNQGSGIGLAITKEFVKLHNGKVSVKSMVDKGSCFLVELSLQLIVEKNEQSNLVGYAVDEMPVATETSAVSALVQKKSVNPVGPLKGKKERILLVEDNEDFMFYLKDNLKEYFNITEAANGREGWQRALSVHPDLIVSDISMPEMNGIDLCHKIKNDKRTAYIPVILLTALTGEDQQLKGLETGANDYLTKPFNFEILLSKIRNLLAQQEKAKKLFGKQVQAVPTEAVVESADEKFIKHALELVEKNMANDNFSVEELSRTMFLSRVALYKKLLALTGKTPVEFIRSIRIKRAAQLLSKSDLTIAEVAYDVGFNNPKYFSRYFKAEFDVLPSAYQAEKRKEAASHAIKNEMN